MADARSSLVKDAFGDPANVAKRAPDRREPVQLCQGAIAARGGVEINCRSAQHVMTSDGCAKRTPTRHGRGECPGGCECDAGIPCPACNPSNADQPPRSPAGMKIDVDKSGSRH
jgi:hypothetical protein